jgi:hypothetical protein|eukprot:SAG25_NODE_235_length_11344_cov_3.848911_2_plen_236_part_00
MAAVKGAPASGSSSMENWVISTSSAPPEAIRLFRMLSRPRNPLEPAVLRPILADAVKYFISGALDQTIWTESAIKGARRLDWAKARDVFTGCYKTLRAGTRARMTPEQLEEDLVDLKVPKPIIGDFQAAVVQCLAAQDDGSATLGARVAMTSTAHARRLVQLKWRVDVTMTTNTMLRVRKPSILLQFHFDDGKIVCTGCSVEKFQDLRYNVARMLKDMRQMERSRWVEDPAATCA